MTQYDPGLQPERTQLAWRRTALSIAVVSLIAARALPLILGSGVWVIPGAVGVTASALFWVASARRAGAVGRALSAGHPDRMPDARLILMLVVFAVAAGVLALVVLLVGVPR